MIPFTIDGKKIQVPTRWAEINFGRFVDLAETGNNLNAQLALLLGMSEQEFVTSNFSDGLDAVFAHTKFLRESPAFIEFPTECGPYKLKPEIQTMAQLNAISEQCEISVKAASVKVVNRTSLETLAMTAAIICQGINEPFDKEKAGYLAKQFFELPCEQVLSAGNYYQAKAFSLVYQKPIETFRKGMKFYKPPFFKRLWHSLSS